MTGNQRHSSLLFLGSFRHLSIFMHLRSGIPPLYGRGEVRSTPAGVEVDPRSFDFISTITAWNSLQAFALIFHIAVLLTVLFSRTIRRSSTWILIVLSGMLYSGSCLLLINQQTGPPPSTGICLVQAMLIYACPALGGASACSFMLQAYWVVSSFNVRDPELAPVAPKPTRWVLLFPPAIFSATLVEVAIVYALDHSSLERDLSGTHCAMQQNRIPVKVTASIVAICGTVVLILEAFIFVRLRREWDRIIKSLTTSSIPPRVILRVVIFGFFAGGALGISFAFSGFTLDSYNTPAAAVPANLALAIMQAAYALILGTQRDILSVWMFWRKH